MQRVNKGGGKGGSDWADYVLKQSGNQDDDPAQCASGPLAKGGYADKRDNDDDQPERHLETVENDISLLTGPSLVFIHVRSGELVGEDDERFDALHVIDWVS